MRENKTNLPKIGILNLGCARNLVDAENLLGILRKQGYSIGDINDCQIAIVNTCAFIEEAKQESIDTILDLIELKRIGKIKKIIVQGCLSQRYQHRLQKYLPQIDAFVGKLALSADASRYPLTPSHYAYLKICEGCYNHCSYCAIPKIKGRLMSLPQEDIIRKARLLDEDNIRELNIIGQDISAYGLDIYGECRLPVLLKEILRQTRHIPWIRLLYLYPTRVDDNLLDLIKENPRICRYLDIPIQHINNRILKLMNRRTTQKQIRLLIDKIKRKLPNVALRTTLIVGFPGETDKEFQELVSFVEEVGFARLGVFIYSREEGTVAYNMKPQVPQKIKEERFDILMSRQQEIARRLNAQMLNKKITVLIEEKDRDCYLGRSQYDAPEVDGLVYVRSQRMLKSGEMVEVNITDTLEYDLVGEC